MPELVTLVRALDHLRNAGELEREGQRVRDAMRTAAISYRLRVGREEGDFRGYGGMYDVGDRLVATSEDALRVVSIEEPEDGPAVLSCERW